MTQICLSVFIVCIHKHVYTCLFLHVFQLWTLPKIRASRWNVAAIKCVWLRITKHPPVSVNAGWGKCPLLGLTHYRNSSKNSGQQTWPKRLAHLLPRLNKCMTSWITYTFWSIRKLHLIRRSTLHKTPRKSGKQNTQRKAVNPELISTENHWRNLKTAVWKNC